MSFDPFGESVDTTVVDGESFSSDPPESPSRPWRYSMGPDLGFREKSLVWSYDVETVPDEERFPKPAEKQIEKREVVAVDALKSIDTLKAEIARGLTDDQVANLLDAERCLKNRKGAIEALQKYADGGDEELAKWKKLATDPARCRIVAISFCHQNEDPTVMLATTKDEERAIVSEYFSRVQHGTRVGFNINSFDERVLAMRAMMLGVVPPNRIRLQRHNSKNCIDLMSALFIGVGDAVNLKSFLSYVGIEPPAGQTNGSHVLEMVEGGNWDSLANYVASDAWTELELFNRCQGVLEL